MPAGEYVIKGHLCDSHNNNCVTAPKYDGKSIEQTGEVVRKVGEDGVFRHMFSLANNAFVLYRVEKI